MPSSKVIQRPHRQVCIGDLDKRVTIHTRAAQSPEFQGADLTEKFAPSVDVWAGINTVAGKTFFAGVNADVAITHEIYIRYRDDVTAETWVEFENRYFTVVAPEDFEERHEFMRLLCTERGDKESLSTHA